MKTFALALLLAALGFSYALATHTDAPDAFARAQLKAGARVVDEPLRFTNPFLAAGSDPGFPNGGAAAEPQGFDLGDAELNKTFTRYLTAAGGYLPYSFETRANFDFVGSFDTPPVPKIFLNGRITDSFGTSINGAARFNGVVTEVLGTQRTGTFRMNVLPPAPSRFRFAQNALPTAQLGNTYFTNLETLGGTGTITYSIVSVNGAAASGLEALGLTLTTDGIIYGRPVILSTGTAPAATTIKIVVKATDSANKVARDRSGTQDNQNFDLMVEGNTMAVSEILATRSSVNLSAKGTSFTYFGSFDPKGLTAPALAGSPFTLRIAPAGLAATGAPPVVLTATFDGKGKAFLPFGGSKRNGMKVTVSPVKSTIQVTVTGAAAIPNLSTFLMANKALSLPVVVMMEFKHYRACEPLVLTGRSTTKALAVKYNLGPRATPPAGGFQVISVVGNDKGFNPNLELGDVWYVRWLGVPRFGIEANAASAFPRRDPTTAGMGQSGTVNATIRIGESFEQMVTAKIQSHRLKFQATGKDPGLYKVYLDGERYLHSLTSNIISTFDSDIPQAITTKNPTIFKFGMDVPGFSGQTGRVIIPNNLSWFSR